MATKSADSGSPAEPSVGTSAPRALGLLLGCGFLAALGSLALTTGLRNFLEYLDGGVYNPGPYLLGVTFVLSIGFAFVLGAIAGSVRVGVR